MMKIFTVLFIYVAAVILLIAFKCWIILATIYGLGICAFIYALLTAKKCPEDLDDLFE